MTSTLQTVSLVTLCLGAAFLIAAAVIFFKLKIWVVIADLSGKTAQQSIARLRSQSGQAAPRKRHYSYVANSSVIRRNKGTENLQRKKTETLKRKADETEKLHSTEATLPLSKTAADADGTMILDHPESDGTMPLDQEDLKGTMPLDQEDLKGTMPLDAATDILTDAAEGPAATDPGATVVIVPEPAPVVQREDFVILEQTVLLHTEEVIPQQSEFHT